LRGKYFLLMTTGVMKVANHMIACATAGTNHKQATTLCVDVPCFAQCCLNFTWCIYLGRPCEALIFILVVELQFLLCVYRKIQCSVITGFILYMHTLICFLQLRKILRIMSVYGSVTPLFIPLWKPSFLHMC